MGTSRNNFMKYPRTPHIFGSVGTTDDKYLNESDSMEFIINPNLVIEEKIDGTNVGMHFSTDGKFILQCRGHEITSKMHPQFDPLKSWTNVIQKELYSILATKYILYGEWMYARHHLKYNKLPHYFIEFDIYDKEKNQFLDTTTRQNKLKETSIESITMLNYKKLQSIDDLVKLLARSKYGDVLSEGLYLKIEQGGKVNARSKFVRKEFTGEVQALGSHWSKRQIETNKLQPGVSIW